MTYRVCPVLPEVYTSVVGLHNCLYFVYFFISVSTPMVLCKLLGVDSML